MATPTSPSIGGVSAGFMASPPVSTLAPASGVAITLTFAKEMKTDKPKFPPTWVWVFSHLFLIFLLSPFLAAWWGSGYSISAFGLDLEEGVDPLGWMLAINAVLFMGALTGLFIVTKRAFAYSFGIVYCMTTLAVTIPANFSVGDWNDEAWGNIALQYPLLICFLVHLIRNRTQWKTKNANKAEMATPRKPSDQSAPHRGAPFR